VLGSGGFGQTYVAEDTKRPGNPLCVLKHLSFSSQDPAILRQVRRMFFAEAETLENLGRHDQIPQLLAYFEESEEFYLVQEYVQGHPLSEEFATGRRLTEDQVLDLLEDVLQILDFVHTQQVIHRDLKPENLIRRDRDQKLVLIDFGAVKTIENAISDANTATQFSVPVYTSGYAASEQCLGQPRYNSDLYSLGMIAIQALTGVRPAQLERDPRTGEPIWRDKTAIGDDLASVLELLTKFHFADRYQTAKQVLEALVQVRSASVITQAPLSRLSKLDVLRSSLTQSQQQTHQQTRSSSHRLKLAALGLGVVAVLGGAAWAVMQTRSSNLDSPSIIPSSTALSISAGKTLISSPPTLPSKQAGIDQFRQGNLKEAVRLLQQARQKDKSDPETLIYLNNARIGDEQAHTIAAVLPVRTQPTSAFEVLRGIAQAQDQINRAKGINRVKLKVAIASDDAKPEQAKQIAQALVNDPTIVGVVGHGTSEITFETGEIYQAGGLAVISPLSSAKDLSKFNSTVFRTMPNDQLLAKNLATYMQTRLKKRKVAIFFNQKSLYSASLKNAFKSALYLGDRGQTVEELDLGNPAFNGVESVDQAIKKGAEVLLLTPNSDVLDRSLLAINANRRRLPLLAGDTLYSRRILSEMGMAANGMVVAVPSAVRTKLGNSPFEKQARSLWGKSADWRTVMGYDAAQVLIAALQKAQTRNGIRSALSLPEFSAAGAVHPIKFTADGDREMEIALMRVTPTKSGQFEFRPVSK
jgi:ABC-type branched-subunit amino acid transport system substrate-binding protein